MRATALDDALDVPTEAATLATLLERLHAARFSGVVLLHWQNGVPRVAEFPSLQVRLSPLPKAGGS